MGEILDEIASELNLLRYSHHTPEAFFERRDFLARRVRRLARRAAGEPDTAPKSEPYRAPGQPEPARTRAIGAEAPRRRIVTFERRIV